MNKIGVKSRNKKQGPYGFNGFAIALAWPETWCKRAGGWYDNALHHLGISKQGYYKVGHAAVVLVHEAFQNFHYFDFGRYHAPHGYGRVRNAETDHDLRIYTKAVLSDDNTRIANLESLLDELVHNPATHGEGTLYVSVTRIAFDPAFAFALRLQDCDFIPYGPFVRGGTNCSRFVSRVIRSGNPSFKEQMILRFPVMLTPTPMWNVRALGSAAIQYRKNQPQLTHPQMFAT